MKKLIFMPLVAIMLLFVMSCSKEDSSSSTSNSSTTEKYLQAVEGKSFETNVKGISYKKYYLSNPSGVTNSYVLTVYHSLITTVYIRPVEGTIVEDPAPIGNSKKWKVKLPICFTYDSSSPAVVYVYYNSQYQPTVYYSFGYGCY